MNQILFSFFITFLAGITTLIGIIPCYIRNTSKDYIISASLAFAAGVMITISFTSLIPESWNLFTNTFLNFPALLILGIFLSLGVIFSGFIDQKIEQKFSSNQLYKLGLISTLALMFHNIPEGITTFLSTSTNLKLGLGLSFAIALHNIPEGISIAVPIYYATGSHKKAFFYTLISGFSEFFGAILAYLFIARFMNDFLLGIILAMTVGIMIHISFYELIPSARSYQKKRIFYVFGLLGILVMLICLFH